MGAETTISELWCLNVIDLGLSGAPSPFVMAPANENKLFRLTFRVAKTYFEGRILG